jgi:hypothetical protein
MKRSHRWKNVRLRKAKREVMEINDRCVHTKWPKNNRLNNRMYDRRDQPVEPKNE